MHNIFRFLQICLVFTFSGLLFSRKHKGEKLAKTLSSLGPSFIKLGQALSVRQDIVGEEIAESLTQLQDKIPPFPYKKAKKIIEKEFDKPIDEMFSFFDKKSVAAASIAQVHKAKTVDGVYVAVKILRPDVKKIFARDIKLLYFIARTLNRFKSIKRLKPIAVVDVFAETVKKEMDLRIEAAAASQLKENCANDEWFYVPKIFWQLTSERTLVIEWINGTPANNKQGLLDAGHDLEQITQRISISFLNQAFRDGFFHADMHPGNLFVDANGFIVPVDFGIMGTMDKSTRIYVAQILRGFLTGDYEHVARVHFAAGYVPKHKSEHDFKLACRAIGEPIMGLPANQVSIAKLLTLLFKITEDFEMETQPQLLLFQKTLMLIEGVGQSLYPQLNMWQQAEGWIKDWAKSNLGVEAQLKNTASEIISMLQNMPERIKKIDRFLDSLDK